MTTLRCSILIIGLVTALGQNAWAENIYRWVDAGGVVNYGTSPPAAGPERKTVRSVNVEPAVVAPLSDAEREAQRARALEAQIAENNRLSRQLLAEQIDTERARAELLRAQAASVQSPNGCTAGTDCSDFPVYVGVRRVLRLDPDHGRRISPAGNSVVRSAVSSVRVSLPARSVP